MLSYYAKEASRHNDSMSILLIDRHYSPPSLGTVSRRREGVVGSCAPVAPALSKPSSSSLTVRELCLPRRVLGRYKNDCVTIVTSNIRVPPLPRRYLRTEQALSGHRENETVLAHGILSRRNADDSGSGSPRFGEVRIEATYSKLPKKAKINNDMERP